MKKLILNIAIMTLGTAMVIWALDTMIERGMAGLAFDYIGGGWVLLISLLVGLFAAIYGLVKAVKESKI